MARTLTPDSSPLLMVAMSPKESTMVGSWCFFRPASSINWSSHSPLRLQRQVLLALEASVTQAPVKLYRTQVSMVPNMMSSSWMAWATAGTCLTSQRILKRVKQVETGRPVLALKSPCWALNSSQTSPQRVSHQTMALQQGFPCLFQQTTVSRWLVTPNPLIWSTLNPSTVFIWSTVREMHRLVLAMISRGSCSSRPSLGQICLCSMTSLARRVPFQLKMLNLVEVVDWSNDARYAIIVISSQPNPTSLPLPAHLSLPSLPHLSLLPSSYTNKESG